MRLRFFFAAMLAIAGACTQFSSSSAPGPATPDAEAPEADATEGVPTDAAALDAVPASPCTEQHVFCADFESLLDGAAPFLKEFVDDAGTTLDADHTQWTSPTTSLVAAVEPLQDAGRYHYLERKFDTARPAIDLTFELQLLQADRNGADNDVILAMLAVGEPTEYELSIRLKGDQLLVAETPPGGPKTTHTDEMAPLAGVTGFVKVHLGVDTGQGTLSFDVGSKEYITGTPAAPMSTVGGFRLDIGVTATATLSAPVSYRIDDVTIDTH